MQHKLLGLIIVSAVISLFFVYPTDAFGVNTLKNVFNVTGTYPAGVDQFDVLLNNGGTIGNVSKAFSFMTFNHATDNDPSASNRSWEILNNTAIRIYGHSGTPASNDAVDFIGYVIEYTNTSDMFVQHLNFTLGASATEGEKFNKLPISVNSSSTMILASGVDYDGVNSAYGTEEFGRWRLVNNTDWGYRVFDTPATGDSNIFAQIVDWNVETVRVQTGNATILDGGNKTLQVTPTIVVQPNRTAFIASYDTDGGTSEQTNRVTHLAFLQSNGDMIFNRDSANFNNVFEWQLVEFLDSDMFMIHNSTCTAFGTLPECDEAGAKIASGSTTFNMPIPSVNITTSIPLSPLMSPFGYSMGRGEGGDQGRLDATMVTMELTTPTNILMTRGASSLDTSFGFEVITWGNIAGGSQTFNQQISDTVSAIDLETTLTLNFTAGMGLEDTVIVTDDPDFVVGKGLDDTATVLDDPDFVVGKGLEDNATVTDDPDFVVGKGLEDTATVIDAVDISTIFVVNLDDTGTTLDVVQINITKLFDDAVPVIDLANLDISKIITDLATASDSVLTNVTTVTDELVLDTVTGNDLVILNIVKQVDDTATVSDNVDITRILNRLISDTITVNDPTVLVSKSTISIPSNGTGIPASGGGGGVPSFQRIVGLSIASELFFIEPADRVPSDFVISTFGRDATPTKIVNIQTDSQFQSWFEFSSFPDTLDFDTTVDNSRSIVDPARFTNVALDDFILNVPSNPCSQFAEIISTVACIDPIIYEVPITFTFNKGGVEFRERHIVTIDATQPIVCDPICQLVQFMIENWWWLAGILVMFILIYYVGGTIVRNGGIRTVRRIDSKQFTSFRGEKPRKKFKRGKG